MVLYNGVIGTPKAAIAYAREGLQAEAHNDVWHITAKTGIAMTSNELLTFSQANGKILSGEL